VGPKRNVCTRVEQGREQGKRRGQSGESRKGEGAGKSDQGVEGGVADAVDGDTARDEEEGVRYEGGGALRLRASRQ
jgi:hypothetical protein